MATETSRIFAPLPLPSFPKIDRFGWVVVLEEERKVKRQRKRKKRGDVSINEKNFRKGGGGRLIWKGGKEGERGKKKVRKGTPSSPLTFFLNKEAHGKMKEIFG